eukprot:Selendium_serpulae@DN6603_c0_g1_i1.p1
MKTCFYEVLSLEESAGPSDIKTAYRRAALQWHPDKHGSASAEFQTEAKVKFQAILEAYETLSDPHQRAWYDAHKDQILQGADIVAGESKGDSLNLWPYFRRDCFAGFDDADGGFFKVFSELFDKVHGLEQKENQDEAEDRPSFGGSDAHDDDVTEFYSNWSDFVSCRPFLHATVWNLAEAPDRFTRRAMDQENKAAQRQERKEYNKLVRELVLWVRKRDPRIAEIAKRQLQTQAAAAKEAVERQVTRKREETERKADRAKLESERLDEQEAAKHAYRQSGISFVGDDDYDDSSGEEDEDDDELFSCGPCNKTFKSEPQYEAHMRSKKHKQTVAAQAKSASAGQSAPSSTAAAGAPALACDPCGKRFTSEKQKAIHMQSKAHKKKVGDTATCGAAAENDAVQDEQKIVNDKLADLQVGADTPGEEDGED